METPPPKWNPNSDYAIKSTFKKFQKNHPEEYSALFTNLVKVMNLLNSGQKIGGFNVNFFRSEREGLFRIGQTSVTNAKESRLYVFPEVESAKMFLISIGGKDGERGQTKDINEAVGVVRTIKRTLKKKEE